MIMMKRVIHIFLTFALLLSTSTHTGFGARTSFRAGTLLAEAEECVENGNFEHAISLADSVVRNSASDLIKIQAIDVLCRAYGAMALPTPAEEMYKAGINLFKQSSHWNESLEQNSDYQRFVFNYAQFLATMGRYEDCMRFIEEIDSPLRTEFDYRLKGLKAMALRGMGKYEEALSLLGDVIEMAEETDSTSSTLPTLLNNRGFVNSELKDYESAVKDLTKVVELTGGKNREIARANLALALCGNGDFEQALTLIDTALSGLKKIVGSKDRDYIIALRKKAEIQVRAGKKTEAVITFKDFFKREKNRLADFLPLMNPNTRLNYWTQAKPLLSKCFLVEESDPEFFFDVALMRRETSLLSRGETTDIINRINVDGRALSRHLSPDEALVAFVTYKDVDDKVKYAAVTLDNKGTSKFVELFYEDFVYKPDGNGVSIYDKLLSENPDDKMSLYTDSVLANRIWKPILNVLPKRVKEIHFAPEGVFHLMGIENLPFDGKDRYRLMRRFSLTDLVNKTDEASKGLEGPKLFVGGLDYDRPDNDSNMSVERPNHEAYNELRREIRGASSIFSYLPGTLNEIESASSVVENSTTTTKLTEREFKKSAIKYPWIHLATHGYALDCGVMGHSLPADSMGYDITMNRSGVALTGANICGENGAIEDGVLSAREICDLDLRDTDMVILSACQTAKGMITDESASGLIRALKIAGVRTIVASLWEVDDNSTVIFMKTFYEGLSRGLNRTDAFENARKTTAETLRQIPVRKFSAASMSGRRTGEFVDSYPYGNPWYWAPFILIDP